MTLQEHLQELRSRLFMVAIFFALAWVTLGFGSLITAFFYNKLYAGELLNNGFKVKSLNGADKALIKARLGISKL